jgi:peptide/nickel transport system permease protein
MTTKVSSVQDGATVADNELQAQSGDRFSRPIRALFRNQMLMVGAVMVSVLFVLAILAPVLAPYDPYEIGVGPSMAPPTGEHIMGTDKLGRDLFSRIIYGARTSLVVAIPSIALALVLGLILGLTSGYMGGVVDQVLMRGLDIFMAFPGLLLAIAIVAVLGPSIRNLLITIGLLYTPRLARVVRGPVLSVKEQEFVEAARVSGARDRRIISRHVLPNVTSPVIVLVTLSVAQAILTESALAYLGLGAPPPQPSWGEMLSTSRWFLTSAPWYAVFPGLAIVFAASGFIIMGNGLRDWIDPRRR